MEHVHIASYLGESVTQYSIQMEFMKDCFGDILKFFALSLKKYGKIENDHLLYQFDAKNMMNLWNVFVEYCEQNKFNSS